ncbi:hypothetical protein I545_5900 [Mycobacterium kansasii 662]|uniref:Uncharacterized protein n=1 Tax=Mycobacterium kansasii 662 TaxID=1299326 RepID=X7YRI5_MYCKA|nr:hypothetical protein I545_5900 [Mycobacterium kansasii 662]
MGQAQLLGRARFSGGKVYIPVAFGICQFVATASPARADDQGYLAELDANGVTMLDRNFWPINGNRHVRQDSQWCST